MFLKNSFSFVKLIAFKNFIFPDSVELNIPKLFTRAIRYHPLQDIDISYSPLGMSNHELHLTAFAAHRMNKLRLKQSTVETHLLYNGAGLPMPCPIGKFSFN